MSLMLPPTVSIDIKSSAEKKIFTWFRDDPKTSNWIVLHSLGISNHSKLIYGELDFLVIAPKLGVFALEVKGGDVSRKNGKWIFTDRYGNTNTKSRSPFEQASEGIFSIQSNIKKKLGETHPLSNFLFGFGVMFPDIIFEVEDLDHDQFQVFDKRNGTDVYTYIKNLSKYMQTKWHRTYHFFPEDKLPNQSNAKQLSNILRGDFEKAVILSRKVETLEQELISLTKEQYQCLDQIEDNARCLILGAAGTGKTLLAIEETKRSVKRGKKVALFCFNTSLGKWLNYYFNAIEPSYYPNFVGTFHSYMLSIVCKSKIYDFDNSDNDFYSKILPGYAIETLINVGEQFDKIIIDEGQDLIQTTYLEVMDLLLRKGMSRGQWTIFGDFERQALFNLNKTIDELKRLLFQYGLAIIFKLYKNCRNTKEIGNQIKYVTSFESNSYLHDSVIGLPVDYIGYNDSEDQKSKLESIIDKLLIQGIHREKITILSPKRFENSVVSMLDRIKIYEYDNINQKGIIFSTIQSFKGLENSVIIITDITDYQNEQLLYVGFSRARVLLIVLESKKARKERIELMIEGGKNGQ